MHDTIFASVPSLNSDIFFKVSIFSFSKYTEISAFPVISAATPKKREL